jgi:phage terminase small subunit
MTRYQQTEASKNVVQFPVADQQVAKSEAEIKKDTKAFKPRGLSREQQKVWERTVPEFIRIGRFKSYYVDFFREYCVVVCRMETFLIYLELEGWKYTTEGRNGEQHRPRPEAAQYNDDWKKWKWLTEQLGMSPAADERFHSMQPDLFDDIYS